MSQLQQNKNSVASRTAFDVLTVESGEQSDDDLVSEREEPVIPSVVCVERHHLIVPTEGSIFLIAEGLRPSLLNLPLRKQQRQLPVKKRNCRIRYHNQGVTRMNDYLRRRLCLLQTLKTGDVLHQTRAPLSLVSSPPNPCLLTPHEMKYLHRC